MFGIKCGSRRIMKNKCERKEELFKEGCPGERVEGKNGVDRAAMKFKAEDSLEKIKRT